MPRRKAAIVPLEGCAIALSGRFDAYDGHNHSSLEQFITAAGGTVTRSVTKNTTHVVCTEADYKAEASKVATAKSSQLPILKPEWVIDTHTEKKKLNADDYLWSQTQPPAQASSSQAPQAASNSSASASRKKRSSLAANADEDADEEEKAVSEEPESKKSKTNTAGSKSKAKSAGKKAAPKKEESVEIEEEGKTVAEGQFLKKKNVSIPIDEYCPLTDYSVYIDPDSGLIYDASLNQTNASSNNNKFYRIQLLHESKKGLFKTWTRWGRVGEGGQKAMLGDGTLPDAIKQFEKKFRDKSGLAWEKRADDPRPGKYAFVEKSYNPDDDDDDQNNGSGDKDVKMEDAGDHNAPECTLEPQVKSLMQLIFNQQFFQATMTSLNYDANKLPLGKLSKNTILRGFNQLKHLAALMDDPSLASSEWGTSVGAATENLSNMYYSIIPHAFGRNRPPVIYDNTLLKKEIELLESLSDMKDAAEIMKLDRKSTTTDPVHPLDRQFQGLNLNEMTVLDHSADEFKHLEKYLKASKGQTHHIKYKVHDIFRIERQGEKIRFDEFTEKSKIGDNRRLLWHGSRCTNFGGILSQGLRIAPPEAPVSGYMFGKGIYLADMSSKSANYCCSYISGGQALLLLCEARLGDPMQELTNAAYNASETARKNKMDSTWGQGMTAPTKWMDAGAVHENLKGVQMPDMSEQAGPTNIDGAYLQYNEYICYDTAQVKLRYLFRVEM